MTTQEMIDLVSQRTKIKDPTKVLAELRAAFEWAVNRIFKSADGPQLLITVDEELPAFSGTTREYDLEANLDNSILGLQSLSAKLSSGTNFTKLIPRSTASDEFMNQDSSTAAAPDTAAGLPVYYSVINFGQVRFAPSLPAGTVLRATYSIFGAVPDPTANPTQEDGSDPPKLFHYAMCAKASAYLFNTLDDDRESSWHTIAIETLTDAIHAAGKGVRTQRPVEVQGFRRGRTR